jgi:GNAT superfamily N-acetyltransferase
LASEALNELTKIFLFSGDAWALVQDVMLAKTIGGRIVGIGSLAPTDESGTEMVPCVLGIWTTPELRRQGIATAILKDLTRLSLDKYSMAPWVSASSVEGVALVTSVRDRGIPVELIDTAKTLGLEFA